MKKGNTSARGREKNSEETMAEMTGRIKGKKNIPPISWEIPSTLERGGLEELGKIKWGGRRGGEAGDIQGVGEE